MLTFDREKGQSVYIDGYRIKVTVIALRRGKVRLGFEAPREVTIHREEVMAKIEHAEAEAKAS